MKDAQPRAIYLKDYQQPDYWIETTALSFELGEESTLVTSTLNFKLNDTKTHAQLPELTLVGENMELVSVAIDGAVLSGDQYKVDSEQLVLQPQSEAFETYIVTRIKPQENTSLEGLYKSGGMFCTQCEAEGFRKITYYLDRPDVMSIFTTTVIGDKDKYPVLLSNGNAIERKDLDDGRHMVTWNDPFKKPAYLFALVGGNLEFIEDTFTTMSGREVTLRIFVEPHNITKCDHAMRSLKKSMKWDEEVYGREYDLDIFMIVAVDDFNMGAMENKGLNIFNSTCVLARPDNATDAAHERIDAIVAHEYFHNWSGNRVTCRDWFQLSLKEGFTVFRDAEYTADMYSRTVKRIQDVNFLRSAQFVEDAGPMAHPIRPESFIEISNFYTLTVYEKGAEVVRMIHSIVGSEGFRKGSDLYFDRHDGQAVTTEDFVAAMEDANGVDLSQFKRWYSQAGTPVLDVSDSYDEDAQEYSLTIKQSCPATPGQDTKLPFHIPVAIGLLDGEGEPMPLNGEGETTVVLDLKEPEQTFTFKADERPLPSLLRGFSAPVKVNYDYSREDLIFLMSHDEDGFNRWDSCQRLAINVLMELVADIQAGRELAVDPQLLAAYGKVLADESLDLAMIAEMLLLPSETLLAEQMDVIDVDAIHQAREFVRGAIAEAHKERLQQIYNSLNVDKPYQAEPEDIAERRLKNIALSYLVELDDAASVELAQAQFAAASNMTDSIAALSNLIGAVHESGKAVAEQALAEFAEKWADDTNVMNMWFSTQVTDSRFGTLAKVRELMEHPGFDKKNPNKMRSLVSGYCSGNLVNFHNISGESYEFLADEVIRIDALNPQLASRLINPLTRWKRYDEKRRELMLAALKRIQQQDLSKDLFEVVSKSLA
ncbi:aminopeptidase N [Parendozoicomonas haliclonae]|uniref:Aminopeptidase N n=1 Tax=Parendozoicomonas haliclonae TaxID=1960125 RepID=A0A1X7AM29_9GAMM|nr:aminopeptidase N [Parendozoicomonas haliclonae]SMA49270.1 Aminopeptidase N [Parendozoicomonas haliclonae]